MLKFIGKHKKFWIFLASVLVSIAIFIFHDSLVKLQGYGYLGIFILSILGNATIILPTPVFFAAFVGGAVFNPYLIAFIIALGATIGELTGYFAGYGAEDLIKKDLRLIKVKQYMEKFGLWTIFVLALIPNPFFDLAGIVSGATQISLKKYLAVVFLGKLIKFGIIAYLGYKSVAFLDSFI